MKILIVCVYSTFVILIALTSCDRHTEEPLKVSLKNIEELQPKEPVEGERKLRVAIAAVISPKESFILYKEFLDYISAELGMPVQLIQRETYEEINNLVKDNELDIAFVCSGAYVRGHDEFGMELLVAPVAYGKPVYHSYWIVPVNSDISTIEGLRGQLFAFSDPLSNSGKLSPTYVLSLRNENIDTFFKDYIYTYSHDRSIEMVAHSLVDGAAVDGLIWEYVNVKKPEITTRTKIIYRSEPYGIPPVVVPKQLPGDTKEKLRKLFLHVHETEKGKAILSKLFIDRFVVLKDSDYASVRKMQRLTEKQ